MKTNFIKESGFTLVELLVALLIGLLLSAAIVTIYLGSQSTFRAAQGVSRSQEATRFAVHFLKTDIRQAGYAGCTDSVSEQSLLNQNDPNYSASFDSGIFGWDFQDTGPGETFALTYEIEDGDSTNDEIQAARESNSEAATLWNSRFILPAVNATEATPRNLPSVIEDLSPLRGSDIVSITISEPIVGGVGANLPGEPVYVSRTNNQRTLTLNTVDADDNATAAGIPAGGIVTVGDCSSFDTFQNTATNDDDFFSIDPAAAISPGNALTGAFRWQKKWDESALLFRSVTSVYFVGTGGSGIPSLFRYSSSCGLIDAAGSDPLCGVTVSALVEGVENMQVMYGEDSNDDGVPNQVVAADEVNDFDNVVSVELGVLVRSVDSGLDNANTTTYVLAGNTTIDPPNDRFQRFVSNTTIRLHNQGL